MAVEAAPRRAWLWRVAAFLAVFLALQAAWAQWRDGPAGRFVVEAVTVRSAAALIDWGWPGVGVVAEGPRLKAPGGGLNVLNGCEGVDVALLLAAAMAVAPIAWASRMLGLLLGLPLVFVLNQWRLVALFHAFRHDRSAFEWLHGAVAPLAMVLMTGLFYLLWVERQAPRRMDR